MKSEDQTVHDLSRSIEILSWVEGEEIDARLRERLMENKELVEEVKKQIVRELRYRNWQKIKDAIDEHNKRYPDEDITLEELKAMAENLRYKDDDVYEPLPEEATPVAENAVATGQLGEQANIEPAMMSTRSDENEEEMMSVEEIDETIASASEYIEQLSNEEIEAMIESVPVDKPEGMTNREFALSKHLLQKHGKTAFERYLQQWKEEWGSKTFLIHDGERYEIATLSPNTNMRNTETTISASYEVVSEETRANNIWRLDKFLTSWLGGTPSGIDNNNSIYAGHALVSPKDTNVSIGAMELLVSGANSFAGSWESYYAHIRYIKTADGRNVAEISLTCSDYDEFVRNLPTTPQYRPSRNAGKTLQVTFDPDRARWPYVAAIGLDSNGNLVAQPYVFPNDKVIEGEMGFIGNFKPDGIPFEEAHPDTPFAERYPRVPEDVTDEYLRPSYLLLNPEFSGLIE